ncbi:golgin subfamily B member 1-like isoform X3 [Nyctibius grandis]|uniref:golgin subfamily B member 1-like isoform X3 n=1 Tax=Nyctibius grandis TaxID=48427 RepID=UPI0035BBFBDD
MDPEAEIKKQINPFYCNICKIWCASALNLQTHFLGFKHKTVEEALKAHGIVKTASGSGEQVKTPVKLPDYVQTEPERFHGQTLEEQLNTCKDSEPALGLNYIIEYRSKDNFPFLYECQLCHCKTGLSNMFMHVCGSKHRLAYLVVTDAPIMRRRWQEYEKNVQEEKEKSQKDQAKRDEKVEPNEAIESSKGNKTEEGSKGNNSEKCETNKQLQEENEEVEQEFIANPEEFTSQEELLGYLQSFEILNEDDASFILKVTQTLTDALVEYRQQAASKKDLLDTEYNEEAALDYSTEQSDLTSADISDSDTDYSSSRSAKLSLSVNEEDEPQNFSTGSSEAAYENNITTEFLNSVRNMNVEEVTATLHKIAAANPAFRGIDIPNVIRILTESGTLRRPSNGSTQ